MAGSETPEFDFDNWAKLAKEDPDAFESQRQEALESLIATAPPEMQQRLRGLQWQLDHVRERSNNPLASCVRMSKMMWDRVLGEKGLLEAMQNLNSVDTVKAKESATILSFDSGERGQQEEG